MMIGEGRTNEIAMLNRVTRGWANYYRYINSSNTFHHLSFWAGGRFMIWLRNKFRLSWRRSVLLAYEHLKPGSRLKLVMFMDVKLGHYRIRLDKPNPYLERPQVSETRTEMPILHSGWWGASARDGDLRLAALERDGFQCQQCGATEELEAHHITPLSKGGADVLENVVTLCKTCHRGKGFYALRH